MSQEQALLPCPFCGGDGMEWKMNDEREAYFGWYFVQCSSCQVRTWYEPESIAARAKWNTRTRPDAGNDLIEAARIVGGTLDIEINCPFCEQFQFKGGGLDYRTARITGVECRACHAIFTVDVQNVFAAASAASAERIETLEKALRGVIQAHFDISEMDTFAEQFGDGEIMLGLPPNDIYQTGYGSAVMRYSTAIKTLKTALGDAFVKTHEESWLEKAVNDARGRNNPPSKPTVWACDHDTTCPKCGCPADIHTDNGGCPHCTCSLSQSCIEELALGKDATTTEAG